MLPATYGYGFYVHINKTYPLSMEALVNVFLAQPTAGYDRLWVHFI